MIGLVTDQELQRRLLDRMFRLLDVARVIATGERESFSMDRFDLTCDVEDREDIAMVVWERCSQPFAAIVNPETREVSKIYCFDTDKCRTEVMPRLARLLVLDELADI